MWGTLGFVTGKDPKRMICYTDRLGGQGGQGILDGGGSSGGYVFSAELMESCQDSVCFGQGFDPADVGFEPGSGDGKNGHVVGQDVKIGPRSAAAQT